MTPMVLLKCGKNDRFAAYISKETILKEIAAKIDTSPGTFRYTSYVRRSATNEDT
jgi:hypothetical protein